MDPLIDKLENGILCTWGVAQGGRLGHCHDETKGIRTPKYVKIPTAVTGLGGQHITHVSCGAFHMLATDINGHAWAWGSGADGELGLLDDEQRSITLSTTPMMVSTLKGWYITSVACSSRHSVALSSRGQVHTWGCSKHGKLGRVVSNDHFVSTLPK